MKKILIPMIVIASLLTACSAMAMSERAGAPRVDVIMTIPLLPPVVELRQDPYYYHSGYYYHYNDRNEWSYSESKRGPWATLPRDHYPKETRYKGKSWHHDKGRDQDNRHDDDKGRKKDDRHRDKRSRDNDDRDRDDRGHDDRGNDDRR